MAAGASMKGESTKGTEAFQPLRQTEVLGRTEQAVLRGDEFRLHMSEVELPGFRLWPGK